MKKIANFLKRGLREECYAVETIIESIQSNTKQDSIIFDTYIAERETVKNLRKSI